MSRLAGSCPVRAMPLGAGGEPVEVETKTPLVTYAIIAANVLVYLVTAGPNFLMVTAESWVDLLGFSPILLLVDPWGQWYRLFTAMFVHADIFHIFFNMYFLYIFGKAVENTVGGLRYLALYLVSGLLASVFHVVFSYLLGGPIALTVVAVGASGAISGVLGAYLLLYPGARMSACFFFLIPFCFTSSAAAFLLFWFALQVFYGYTTIGAGIAFFAHAGGFVGGLALLPLVADRYRVSQLKLHVEWVDRLYGFLYTSPTPRGEGLHTTTKTLFAILTLALVAGAGAAYFYSASHQEVIAATKLTASIETPGVPLPEISGFVVFEKTRKGLEPLGLGLVPPPMRITVNRLLYSGTLYNPSMAGKTVVVSSPVETTATLVVCDRRVSVPVVVEELRGRYNQLGLLDDAAGRIATRIVYVTERLGFCHYTVSSEVTRISFRAESYPAVEVTGLIAPQAAIATITGLAALYVALARDREYVIIPG